MRFHFYLRTQSGLTCDLQICINALSLDLHPLFRPAVLDLDAPLLIIVYVLLSSLISSNSHHGQWGGCEFRGLLLCLELVEGRIVQGIEGQGGGPDVQEDGKGVDRGAK
jgi:hypothetical protein